jgi:FkbM family methyltransferase
MDGLKKREFTAPNGVKRVFNYREGTNDENTIIACFEQDYYKILKLVKPGDTVIDLGAHLGGVSLLASTIPNTKIIAVEALPENAEILKLNVIDQIVDNVTVYNRAVWQTPDIEVTMSYGDDGTENGRVHNFMGSVRTAPTTLKTVKIPTITIDEIMKENGIEECKFLKLDIEGAEENLFDFLPTQFEIITGEYHNNTFEHFFPYTDIFNVERAEYGYFICKRKENHAW